MGLPPPAPQTRGDRNALMHHPCLSFVLHPLCKSPFWARRVRQGRFAGCIPPQMRAARLESPNFSQMPRSPALRAVCSRALRYRSGGTYGMQSTGIPKAAQQQQHGHCGDAETPGPIHLIPGLSLSLSLQCALNPRATAGCCRAHEPPHPPTTQPRRRVMDGGCHSSQRSLSDICFNTHHNSQLSHPTRGPTPAGMGSNGMGLKAPMAAGSAGGSRPQPH